MSKRTRETKRSTAADLRIGSLTLDDAGAPLLSPPPLRMPRRGLVQNVTMSPSAPSGGVADCGGEDSTTPTRGEADDSVHAVGNLEGDDEAEVADELDVPMLDEATHLPGIRAPKFSPLAFYALSRVERPEVDTSDEALYLHYAPCPKVSREGIAVGGQLFFHPDLQPIVDTVPVTAERKLVIRYNRALFARGALREVTVCLKDSQRITELVRCKRRKEALEEIDYNLFVAERQRRVKVLLAKHAFANEELISLEAGTAAVEALRDDQAARARRQWKEKPAPKAARPRGFLSRRDELAAQEQAEQGHYAASLQLVGDAESEADVAVGGEAGQDAAMAPGSAAERTGESAGDPPGLSRDGEDAQRKSTSRSGRHSRRQARRPGLPPTATAAARPRVAAEGRSTRQRVVTTPSTVPSVDRAVDAGPGIAETLGGVTGFVDDTEE